MTLSKRKPKKSRKIPLSSKLIGLVKKVAQTPTVAGGSASVINILPQQTQRRRAPARKQEEIKKAVIQPQVIPQIITQQSRDSSSLYDTAFKSAITKLLEQKLTQPTPAPTPAPIPAPIPAPAPAPIPEVKEKEEEVKKEEPKKEEVKKPKKIIKIINDENNNLLPELKKGNVKMEDILKKQEQPKLQEVEQVQEQEAGPSMSIIREEEPENEIGLLSLGKKQKKQLENDQLNLDDGIIFNQINNQMINKDSAILKYDGKKFNVIRVIKQRKNGESYNTYLLKKIK